MKCLLLSLLLITSVTEYGVAEPINSLQQSADNGDEKAMFILGEQYADGYGGVDKDENKALYWYRKLAEKGSPWGQHALGECYKEGKGVSQDFALAAQWYRKAADQDNAASQAMLADLYFQGQGVATNEEESFKWMQKAARNDDSDSMLKLGMYYAAGIGIEKNSEEAIAWIQKAAEKGSSISQCIVGQIYMRGNGAPINYKLAADWFNKAAESFSMYRGDFNSPGLSTLLLRAGMDGDVIYLTTFGIYLDRGGIDFPKINKTKVMALAEQGDVGMQVLLGMAHMAGFGIDKNTREAVKWFNKAADMGHEGAKSFIATYNTNDLEGAAVDWFREEGEKGNSDALVALGFCYSTGIGVVRDEQAAIDSYIKAAELNNARAQFLLSARYLYGLGVEKNEEKASLWFSKALDNKYPKALLLSTPMPTNSNKEAQGDVDVGEMLKARIEYGAEAPNLALSINRIREEAENGDVDAQKTLASCYYEGIRVDKDLEQAFKWYRKAAEQNDKEAQFNLGICYAKGEGTDQNIAKSVVWVRKAAEQGLAIAQANLGMRYMNGEGVLQDDRQACVHYLIAGALGYPNISIFINELRETRLTTSQYADAQRTANNWLDKFNRKSSDGMPPEGESNLMPIERAPQGTGSGFVISSDGYFLTCAHVVEDAGKIFVRLKNKTYPAKMIRADLYNDIALLKIEGTDFKPIPLASDLPEMGTKVFTVGYPNPDLQGESAKYTDGSISSLSGILDDIRTMQITVPIQGGNSGGPLLDSYCNALGLVVAQLNAATVFEYTGTIPQNVNFAIKICYAMPLVQSVPGLVQRIPPPRSADLGSQNANVAQDASGLILIYK